MRDAPRTDLEHINTVLERMRSDPFEGDIKFLRGSDRVLRRRVGAWRVLFQVHANRRLVVVLAVIRRSSVTY